MKSFHPAAMTAAHAEADETATDAAAPEAAAADAAKPAEQAAAQPAPAPVPVPAAPAPSKAHSVLSLSDAIETALSNNLDSKIAGHTSRAARAEVLTSRAPLLPQVNFNASWGVNFDLPYGMRNNTYQSFNASLRADQLIYDFGKAKRKWEAAQATAEGADNTQLSTRHTVIFSVRSAFFDALQARDLVSVGEKTLENHQRHIEQTQSMVDVGTRPTIDLVKLKSSLASAKASLIQAQGNERIARANLAYLLGQPLSDEVELAEPSLGQLSYESMTHDALLQKAIDMRPDLASQRAVIRARRLQLESVESNLWPALYATAGAGWNWRHITESNVGFDVGLRLTWTIFDGMSNKGTRTASEENLAVEELRLKSQEDKISTALQEASLNVSAARSALEALDEALSAAQELLTSAEERYAEGAGSIIELTDAQFDVAEAESKRVRGLYDLLSARAALLDAVGAEDWK